MLPKAGGSPSVTLLLGGSESSEDGAQKSRGGKRSLMSCVMGAADDELLRGGEPRRGAWCSDPVPDFFPERKMERKLEKSPAFLRPAGLGLAAARSMDWDRWRLLCLRLRSFFLDLTRPMQETLGEDGSITRGPDFPVDPDGLGNNRVFPGLAFFRFFSPTKLGFWGFGSPMIEALDFLFTEKR